MTRIPYEHSKPKSNIMEKQLFTRENEKLIWAAARSVLELDTVKHKKNGKRSQSHWSTFEKLLRFSTFFLKVSGIMRKGQLNALNLNKKTKTFAFKNLPKVFNNYKILHMSD